jgi:hypothetical protein
MKKHRAYQLAFFFTRLGSMRPERYACAFFARNCRGPLQLRAFAARVMRENSSSSVFETRSANKDIKRHNFAIKFNEAGAYHKMQPTSTSQDVSSTAALATQSHNLQCASECMRKCESTAGVKSSRLTFFFAPF